LDGVTRFAAVGAIAVPDVLSALVDESDAFEFYPSAVRSWERRRPAGIFSESESESAWTGVEPGLFSSGVDRHAMATTLSRLSREPWARVQGFPWGRPTAPPRTGP
jgi:hypothetical protein